MLSELTTLVIDSIDQLQAAADRIYNRQVFFITDDGDCMSIKMMHEQNAAVAARQISDSPDEVYLMYALITCQLWWMVSSFVGEGAQFKFGMLARHIYMYLYQCTCACACVCVCACMCTQECLRFLTARGKWWKVVAHLSTALCSLCSTSGSSAQVPAEAESQLEVCI